MSRIRPLVVAGLFVLAAPFSVSLAGDQSSSAVRVQVSSAISSKTSPAVAAKATKSEPQKSAVNSESASMDQIGGRIRPFHKLLMECIAKGNSDCWRTIKLSDMAEDLR